MLSCLARPLPPPAPLSQHSLNKPNRLSDKQSRSQSQSQSQLPPNRLQRRDRALPQARVAHRARRPRRRGAGGAPAALHVKGERREETRRDERAAAGGAGGFSRPFPTAHRQCPSAADAHSIAAHPAPAPSYSRSAKHTLNPPNCVFHPAAPTYSATNLILIPGPRDGVDPRRQGQRRARLAAPAHQPARRRLPGDAARRV